MLPRPVHESDQRGWAALLTTHFDDALANALKIAATSPSSHNCQPWVLVRLGPEALLLVSDRDRELRTLPAHRAEMRVSCGLFWRLLHLALAAQGWVVDTESMPELSELPPTWTPLRVARFHFNGAPDGSLDDLRSIAGRRHTNRGPYLDRAVPSTVLGELGMRGAVAEPRVHIRHLTIERDRNLFAAFVARHGGREFAHRAAWREAYSFIRRTETEARIRGDGYAFTTLFGPLSTGSLLLRRVVLAPAAMSALRLTGFPRLLSGKLAAIVRRSPVIVSMSLPDSADPEWDLVTAGGVLLDYWLRATAFGLVLHPVSVVIQHEDLRRELQAGFDLPGRVFFIARLGYPAERFPSAPRRPAAAALRAL